MLFRDRNITVVKFVDNVKFTLEGEAVRTWITTNHTKTEDCHMFKVRGTFTNLVTNGKDEDAFLIVFKGFFRNTVEGVIWKPDGIKAVDYDKYEAGMPYLLEFKFETFEKFNPNKE